MGTGRTVKIFHAVIDFITRWLQPLVAFVALLSGGFLTYNFANLRERYPNWRGPLEAIESNLPTAFVITAVTSFVLTILVSWKAKKLSVMQKIVEESKKESKDIKISSDAEIESLREKYAQQTEELSNVIVILCDGLMLNLANKLELEQDSQVRLSLYVHDGKKRVFIPCGRYSRNPTYARPGRTSYPDNQGCIEKGWSNGWHFDNQVPGESQPVRRRDYNLRNYNIPHETTDKMTMKSTLYAVKRLDTYEDNQIAVIVVEALDPNAFTKDKLHDTLQGSVIDYARVIRDLRAYVPNPETARESGL